MKLPLSYLVAALGIVSLSPIRVFAVDAGAAAACASQIDQCSLASASALHAHDSFRIMQHRTARTLASINAAISKLKKHGRQKSNANKLATLRAKRAHALAFIAQSESSIQVIDVQQASLCGNASLCIEQFGNPAPLPEPLPIQLVGGGDSGANPTASPTVSPTPVDPCATDAGGCSAPVEPMPPVEVCYDESRELVDCRSLPNFCDTHPGACFGPPPTPIPVDPCLDENGQPTLCVNPSPCVSDPASCEIINPPNPIVEIVCMDEAGQLVPCVGGDTGGNAGDDTGLVMPILKMPLSR